MTMDFINRQQLLGDLLAKKPLDSTRLLADVDREAVFQTLDEMKGGLRKSFRFTDEPMEEEALKRMPEQDQDILWDSYARLMKTPRQEISILFDLLERYPDVRCIHNYLGVAYSLAGEKELALDTLLYTTEEFPDYLFGRISLAEYYLNHGQYRKIPKVFRRKFEIYEHYPKSVALFHISEVRSFYCVVGCYWAKANELIRALGCYFLLEEVDPDHPTMRQLGDNIIQQETQNIQKTLKKTAPKTGTRRKSRGK